MAAPTFASGSIARSLDWGKLAPLRLRARALAEGIYAGAHKSARRGAGIEFGGFREYYPGDDLRWLDRRSLLLRDKPLVRQFETETDRALRLIVDATASMGYRSKTARGTKYAYSALLAAALARVAVVGGDPVGLSYIGGSLKGKGRMPVSSGREAFERVVGSLEAMSPEGDAVVAPKMLDDAIEGIARTARAGSIVVVLTDALDLPPEAPVHIGSIASRGRVVVVVQILDPDEATFPFEGTMVLKSLEGNVRVESDAEVKDRYLQALGNLQSAWKTQLVARGARWVTGTTDEDPIAVARRIVTSFR
ncbi:MAG: DUF58 domain-containing protein [Polyangiaceae bacterium]|nr:DUF58 domain-containing protein [Polyangiaceae bacterium]